MVDLPLLFVAVLFGTAPVHPHPHVKYPRVQLARPTSIHECAVDFQELAISCDEDGQCAVFQTLKIGKGIACNKFSAGLFTVGTVEPILVVRSSAKIGYHPSTSCGEEVCFRGQFEGATLVFRFVARLGPKRSPRGLRLALGRPSWFRNEVMGLVDGNWPLRRKRIRGDEVAFFPPDHYARARMLDVDPVSGQAELTLAFADDDDCWLFGCPERHAIMTELLNLIQRQGPMDGRQVVWSSQETIVAEGEYKNRRREGNWVFWHPRVPTKRAVTFVKGLVRSIGPWTYGAKTKAGRLPEPHPDLGDCPPGSRIGGKFFGHGSEYVRQWCESYTSSGETTRRWVSWSRDGVKTRQGYQLGNRMHGLVQSWKDGVLTQEYHYSRNNRLIEQTRWYNSGDVQAVTSWNPRDRVSQQVQYFQNGRLAIIARTVEHKRFVREYWPNTVLRKRCETVSPRARVCQSFREDGSLERLWKVVDPGKNLFPPEVVASCIWFNDRGQRVRPDGNPSDVYPTPARVSHQFARRPLFSAASRAEQKSLELPLVLDHRSEVPTRVLEVAAEALPNRSTPLEVYRVYVTDLDLDEQVDWIVYFPGVLVVVGSGTNGLRHLGILDYTQSIRIPLAPVDGFRPICTIAGAGPGGTEEHCHFVVKGNYQLPRKTVYLPAEAPVASEGKGWRVVCPRRQNCYVLLHMRRIIIRPKAPGDLVCADDGSFIACLWTDAVRHRNQRAWVIRREDEKVAELSLPSGINRLGEQISVVDVPYWHDGRIHLVLAEGFSIDHGDLLHSVLIENPLGAGN